MTSILYSPADSRGWGIGDTRMRNYYLIGGALQPSDIYTVRVREHWRRKRGTPRARPAIAAPVVVTPAPARRRARKRAIAIPSTRVLRSATRRGVPMDITPVVPAVPAVVPAAAPSGAVQIIGAKRRRLN